MLNIINKIWRNKIFVVFAILIAITLPTTIYRQSDKDKTIVASSIGIEKKDDEYEVTILAVIPKGGSDVSSNLELFSATGPSVAIALDYISLNIGRNIGLAHCDTIIFTEELMQSNLTEILDYFIRTANLSTNPSLVTTPDSAKDLLNAVKSSNNLLDVSLKNIILSQEDRTLLSNVTIDRFYRAYYSPNSTFTIPVLSVQSSKGDESQGQGGGSNLPEDDSGSSEQGQSGGQSEQKQIKNDNDIAIIKDGVFISKLNDDEKFIYSLLSKKSQYQKYIIEDVNDENFINSTLVFQESDKFILPICKFEDGKPYMEYNIWLSIMIDEVKSQNNHSFSAITSINNLITPQVEELFYKQIEEKLQNTISTMQEKKYDILNLYSKFDAFKYRKFHDYLSSLDNPADYMSEMSIKINLKLNYTI
ncbi:MAG: hypothetical protein IJW59_00360 [Clostridia bacterium]|nr:hypothetical protein [Clostridia bacterium]